MHKEENKEKRTLEDTWRNKLYPRKSFFIKARIDRERFPSFLVAVWVAGLAAATASALLAILVGLAVLQLAMASSAKRVIISYSTALIGKVALATLASEYI